VELYIHGLHTPTRCDTFAEWQLHRIRKSKQEVLGKTDRLLSVDATWTSQKSKQLVGDTGVGSCKLPLVLPAQSFLVPTAVTTLGVAQLLSELELLYEWQFTANQFVLAPSPLRPTTSIFFQLNTCGYSPYVTF
jgi:hypothetical protein